jgi:hypothetical protein
MSARLRSQFATSNHYLPGQIAVIQNLPEIDPHCERDRGQVFILDKRKETASVK